MIINKFYILLIFIEMLDYIESRLFIAGRPVASTVALMDDEFRLAGETITMSLLQGGPAPCFLAEEVIHYLLRQPLSNENNTGVYRTICQNVSPLNTYALSMTLNY